MPQIHFMKIAKPFVRQQKLRLEPLNVTFLTRILGRKNPRAKPSTRPVPVKGMKDVATIFKPALDITLKDEKGKDVPQVIRYYVDVKKGPDLIRNFQPNQLPFLLSNVNDQDRSPSLLFRLLVKQATLKCLQASVSLDAELPENLHVQLQDELARLRQARQEFETRYLKEE